MRCLLPRTTRSSQRGFDAPVSVVAGRTLPAPDAQVVAPHARRATIPGRGQGRRDEPLGSIPGTVPRIPPGFVGCGFRDRCGFAMPDCAAAVPLRERAPGHAYLCQIPP